MDVLWLRAVGRAHVWNQEQEETGYELEEHTEDSYF